VVRAAAAQQQLQLPILAAQLLGQQNLGESLSLSKIRKLKTGGCLIVQIFLFLLVLS
jgi:hypothetical protein